MARTSVVITAVASVLFIGMIIGVAFSPSSESSSASTAVATAPDSDLWFLHDWLDKATNGIADTLIGSSAAKSLGAFLEKLLPEGGIRISRIVAIMNGGSIHNTEAEDQSQLQYIMDNAKRVQEKHGVAVWRLFGGYNTAIWLLYLKLIHQWNVVQGFPTSQDVKIPQCPPHTVVKEEQGFSGYMTPLYDPTITDDPKQQCPTYHNLDNNEIEVAQQWDGTPLEPLLNVMNKMLGMIQGVDSNERSSGADTHSWDMIGGEGKALPWLMSVLGDTLSPFRTLPPYYSFTRPEDNQFALFPAPSYPAEAIETLAFKGLGQPFLEAVRRGDDNAKGAKYAIYLDFMSELEHKKGLQKTGGDAYFSADRKLTHIVYCGKAYVPSEQGRGWWPWSDDPAADWALAMLMFRGSLNVYVTGPEHLMGLHLNIANGLAIGNAEGLPAHHPLRRLITKFTFRTITINRLSAAMLIPQNGLVHRAMPFTVKGLKQVATKAKEIPRTDISERFAKSRLPSKFKDSLPFYKDGIAYHELMLNYVNEFLKAAGHDVSASKDTCSGDQKLVKFWGRWKHAAISDTFPQGPLTCKLLASTLATTFWDVSGYHNVVGTLGSENVDPCFAPWTVLEGATCGPPQESILYIISFSLTSLYQPKITEDYSHLFNDLNRPALLQVEKKFVEDIRKFSDSQSVPAGSHTDPSYVCFKPANNNTAKTVTPNGGPDKIPPGRHFGVETAVSI